MDCFMFGFIVCMSLLVLSAFVYATVDCILKRRKEFHEIKKSCYEHIVELIDGRFNKCEYGLKNLCEVISLTVEEVRLMKKLSDKGKSKK